MGILCDTQIRELIGIEPFEENVKRPGQVSFGVSSYGYDIRVGSVFKIFTNVNSEVIDPKRFSDKIVAGARNTVRRHPENPQFIAEGLYERLRIFRGWLRTVNRIGESRDLQYAIIGTRALVAEYIGHILVESRDRPLYHVLEERNSTHTIADRERRNVVNESVAS